MAHTLRTKEELTAKIEDLNNKMDSFRYASRTYSVIESERVLRRERGLCYNELYAHELLGMNIADMNAEQRTALSCIKQNYELN